MSPEEQTRRLEARMDDGRKLWKLSPMDLKSYNRWYDYSRARDDMFAATKALPREKIKLPKRQKPGNYREPNYPYKYIKQRF